MSEELTFAERYMTARTASSLKIQTRTTMAPSDILAAAGMAGQTHEFSLSLFSMLHSPSRQQIGKIHGVLTKWLEDYMRNRRMRGKPSVITRQVLAWMLKGRCKECGGTGEERIPGTPHLSGVSCPHCEGGYAPLHTENNDAANWLLSEIRAKGLDAETASKSKLK